MNLKLNFKNTSNEMPALHYSKSINKILIFCFLLFFVSKISFGQYNGGIGDGFAVSNIGSSGNEVNLSPWYSPFLGGNGDGYSNGNYKSTGTEGPLPIILLEFKGECSNSNKLLTWSSALELNNEKYIITKSVDGRSWKEVGIVYSKGNSKEITTYVFTDNSDNNDVITYYQLHQVDFNGYPKLLKTISVKSCNTYNLESLTLYPIPSEDFLNVKFSGDTADISELLIYDINGNIVYRSNKIISKIDVSNFVNGSYSILVKSANQEYTKQFIIMR